MNVKEHLELGSKIFEERSKEFGTAYKDWGRVMFTFFPNGIDLKNERDVSRIMIFSSIIGKLTRYANSFEEGGNSDSLIDASVYCAMLNEVDHEA